MVDFLRSYNKMYMDTRKTKMNTVQEIDTYVAQHPELKFYILIAGGMGAGKSYVIENNVKSIPIMDVDYTMQELGFTQYTKEEFSIAMKQIAEEIDAMMRAGKSFVAMGTSSHLPFAIDKLFNAKMKGYTTALVHIDTPIEQAIQQNRERVAQGKRGVKLSDEYRITKTTMGAANTVANLKDTALVDFFIYYRNIRADK